MKRRPRGHTQSTSPVFALPGFPTLGNASSLLPKPAKTATMPSMTNESKVMIRATAPESYRRAFVTTKADGPQTILAEIRQWQLSEGTLGQLTGGDWKRNYTKEGIQTQGHLRLREALANQLLQKSGTKATALKPAARVNCIGDDQDLSAFLESNKWIVHKIHKRRKGYRKSWTWTF